MMRKLEEAFITLNSTVDEDGRVYGIIQEGDDLVISFLHNESRTVLGRLMIGNKHLLYFKFEDERDIFRRTNSWSINYEVFKAVDHIVYETRTHLYQIPKIRAEEFGEVIKFDGTEKKIYVPLKYWEKRHKGTNPENLQELRRRNLLGDSWYDVLASVINSPYMSTIGNWLRERRKIAVVYPEAEVVFRAFKLCSFEHTKVVILGQDPYHDGTANGIAFGFRELANYPNGKSLDVIFDEVERDCYSGFHLDRDFSLKEWAQQGVLLINAVLTVERGVPGSHREIGWQRFTKIVLYELLKDIHPKVFMLWGNDAKALFDTVVSLKGDQLPNMARHLVLRASHPAFDLRNRDFAGRIIVQPPKSFSGTHHFSLANEFLKINNRKPIKW